jgi:hypothetical protein
VDASQSKHTCTGATSPAPKNLERKAQLAPQQRRGAVARIPIPKAMSAIESVPVYFLSQDESWEKPHRHQTRQELRELKKQGLGRFISNGRAFRLFEDAPREVHPDPILPAENSPGIGSTITVTEVLANVGIVADSVRNPAAAVVRAQKKIAFYPAIFDERASLAGRIASRFFAGAGFQRKVLA